MSLATSDAGPAPEFTFRRARKFLSRALRLRCPHCGRSPLFVPLRQTRSLHNWLTPLDGCPRCGYAYEREIGYFLLAIWAVNYTLAAVVGISIYLVLEIFADLSISALLTATLLPPFVVSILSARHAKSLFLAFDHFFDPAVPFRDDDGEESDPAVPVVIVPPATVPGRALPR